MSPVRTGDPMANESSLTNDVLQALLAADDERKLAALRILRGENLPPPTLPPTPLLTLADLGRAMKIHPATLWRWQVPGRRMGTRRRYRIAEVEAYLESPEFEKRALELRHARQAGRDSGASDFSALGGAGEVRSPTNREGA